MVEKTDSDAFNSSSSGLWPYIWDTLYNDMNHVTFMGLKRINELSYINTSWSG